MNFGGTTALMSDGGGFNPMGMNGVQSLGMTAMNGPGFPQPQMQQPPLAMGLTAMQQAAPPTPMMNTSDISSSLGMTQQPQQLAGWPFNNTTCNIAEGHPLFAQVKAGATHRGVLVTRLAITALCSTAITAIIGHLQESALGHDNNTMLGSVMDGVLSRCKLTEFETSSDKTFGTRFRNIMVGFVSKVSTFFIGDIYNYAIVAASIFGYYINVQPKDMKSLFSIFATSQMDALRLISSFVEAARLFVEMITTLRGGPKWKLFLTDPYTTGAPFSMQPITEFFELYMKMFIFCTNRAPKYITNTYTTESVRAASSGLIAWLGKSVNTMKDLRENSISMSGVLFSIGMSKQTLDFIRNSIHNTNIAASRTFYVSCEQEIPSSRRLTADMNDFSSITALVSLMRLSTCKQDQCMSTSQNSEMGGFNLSNRPQDQMGDMSNSMGIPGMGNLMVQPMYGGVTNRSQSYGGLSTSMNAGLGGGSGLSWSGN